MIDKYMSNFWYKAKPYILIGVGLWVIVALEHPLASIAAGLLFSAAGMILWMRKK